MKIQIEAYKKVFVDASKNVAKLDLAFAKHFGPVTTVAETASKY